jgi:hypothetical protein
MDITSQELRQMVRESLVEESVESDIATIETAFFRMYNNHSTWRANQKSFDTIEKWMEEAGDEGKMIDAGWALLSDDQKIAAGKLLKIIEEEVTEESNADEMNAYLQANVTAMIGGEFFDNYSPYSILNEYDPSDFEDINDAKSFAVSYLDQLVSEGIEGEDESFQGAMSEVTDETVTIFANEGIKQAHEFWDEDDFGFEEESNVIAIDSRIAALRK